MYVKCNCILQVKDSTAADCWVRQKLFLPPDVDLPSFPWIKRLLTKHRETYVQCIEICRNDCVAYWDSKHLPVPYRHSHRTKCPKCDEPRWLVDPADGKERPSKVIYHFPVGPYMRDLYSRGDLVPHLYQDAGGETEGELKRSRGYKKKVLDNPNINADRRHLALIGTTDGVPFFDDQKRGAWPFLLKCANLPEGLCNSVANCHLTMLSGNEYYELDPVSNTLRRCIRGPKTLMPHLSIIVDDLLHAYHKGNVVFAFL